MGKRVRDNDRGREIEEKIEAYYMNTDDVEAAHAVIIAVMGAMVAGTFAIVPVETPEAISRDFDPEKVKVGDVIQSSEPVRLNMISIPYDDGTNGMPVFTSREKMEEAELFCSTLEMPMDGYVNNILELPNMRGIVINPSEHGFFIDTDMLRRMRDHIQANPMARRTTGDNTILEKPQDVPEGFTDKVREFIGENLAGLVNRVWFTGLDDEGDKSWLFAVDTDVEEPNEVFRQIDLFVRAMEDAAPDIDYIVSEDGIWPGADLIYDGGSEADGGQMRS